MRKVLLASAVLVCFALTLGTTLGTPAATAAVTRQPPASAVLTVHPSRGGVTPSSTCTINCGGAAGVNTVFLPSDFVTDCCFACLDVCHVSQCGASGGGEIVTCARAQ
jgi:hypothetical protein